MPLRSTLSVGLLACVLAGAGPAVGDPDGTGSPGSPGSTAGPRRSLHPTDSSGDEPGTVAAPVPPGRRSTTSSHRVRWRVAPGVTATRWTQTDARGPIVAQLLTIDPSTPGLTIDYADMGRSVRQVAPVRAILARDDAIAGVNGDFFDIGHTGAPLGLGRDRQRGLLHARQEGWNKAFFVGRGGSAGIGDLPMHATVLHHPGLHVTNLNSPFVAPGGLGVYTSRWGSTSGYAVTQGQKQHVRAVTVVGGRVATNRGKLAAGRPIRGLLLVGRGASAKLLRRLPKGSRLAVRWSLRGRPRMAISGNQFLVRDGIVKAIDDRDLHPRTAVGVDSQSGEVLLLVVDGRQDDSRGCTMVELANLMVDLGADEAINLDGGGSSTMVGRNRNGRMAVLNDPSDGAPRWVANALEVTYHRPRARPARLAGAARAARPPTDERAARAPAPRS